MNTRSRVLSAVALIASTGFATAQTLKPGLWEVNNKMTSASGAMEKGMADMQKQLANMPPEQRKMMEDMMAKQGVSVGAGSGGGMSAKVCLTKDMVDRNEVAAPQGDCQQTSSSRTGNTMKFAFVCTKPPSSGEGQMTFVSPEAYTMKMTVNSTAKGKPETMNMDASGKFLSSECGSIKPIVMPKK
jgi:Protein of unknown function (DUF3617)